MSRTRWHMSEVDGALIVARRIPAHFDVAATTVIEGGAEKDAGVVQIKDLILGAEIAKNATLEEWKDRPSQYEVPRADLVAKVREILESQGQ